MLRNSFTLCCPTMRHPSMPATRLASNSLISSILTLSYMREDGSHGKVSGRFGHAPLAGADEGASHAAAPGDAQHRGVRHGPLRLRSHGDAAPQRTTARQRDWAAYRAHQ